MRRSSTPRGNINWGIPQNRNVYLEAWIWRGLRDHPVMSVLAPRESSQVPQQHWYLGTRKAQSISLSLEEASIGIFKSSPGDSNVQPELRTPCGTAGESAAQRQEWACLVTHSQFIGKDPEAGKDWRQKEKRATEVRWWFGITDSVDMNLANSRRWWGRGRPRIHGLTEGQTRLGDWKPRGSSAMSVLSGTPSCPLVTRPLEIVTSLPLLLSMLRSKLWLLL